MVSEFEVPKEGDPTLDKYQFHWLYANGLLGIIFTFGLLYTSLKSRRARSWLYGTGLSRKFLVFYLMANLDSDTSQTVQISIQIFYVKFKIWNLKYQLSDFDSTVQMWQLCAQPRGCDCAEPGSVISLAEVRNLTLFVY